MIIGFCPETERRILAALRPPHDQPGGTFALRAAARSVIAFSASIKTPSLALLEVLADLCDYDGPLEPQAGLLHRQLSRYPFWVLMLSLREGAPQRVLESVGAVLAQALVEGKPISEGVSRRLQAVVAGRADDRDLKWLDGLVANGRAFFTVSGNDVAEETLRDRVVSFFRAANYYAGEHRHQARNDRRTLELDRYRFAAGELRLRIESDETVAAWMGVCAVTGMPPALAGDIPLLDEHLGNPEIAIALDEGVYLLDLDLVAPGAREMPAPDVECVPASRMLARPLPAYLHSALLRRREVSRDAHTVSALLGCDVPNERDQLTQHRFVSGFAPSLARFCAATETIATRLGLHRVVAAHLGGRYQGVTRSKFYYAAVSREQIWAAAGVFYRAIGWGDPVPLKNGPAAGPQAVATDTSVARWFTWMCGEVAARTPGRRTTLENLLEHHNAYARLVASVYLFCTALRGRNPLPLRADVAEQMGWIGMVDKRSPTVWNASAETALLNVVPVSVLLREQLDCWRRHCAALARRLEKLGRVETDALRAHFIGIAESRTVAALVEADGKYHPRPLGVDDLRTWWPDWFARAGNWARAYWQTRLGGEGLDSSKIDLLMRHTQSGTRPMTSVGAQSITTQLLDVRQAQDRVLAALGFHAVAGIVQ